MIFRSLRTKNWREYWRNSPSSIRPSTVGFTKIILNGETRSPIGETLIPDSFEYGDFIFVRVGRIELPSPDWQPGVLPLNHTRKTLFNAEPSLSVPPRHYCLSIIHRNHTRKTLFNAEPSLSVPPRHYCLSIIHRNHTR